MQKRYIVVGGNPFRNSFTGLRIVSSSDSLAEVKETIKLHYDNCGGLLMVVDCQTGQEAEET